MAESCVLIAATDGQVAHDLPGRLAARGYGCCVPSDPQQFWTLLGEKQPRAVLLHVRMLPGDISGIVPAVHDVCPRASVVLLDDIPAVSAAREAKMLGVFDYLGTDCPVDLLLERVEDALRASAASMPREYLASEIMIPIRSYTCVQANNTVQEGIELLKKAGERFISTGLVMQEGHRAVLVFDGDQLVGVLAMKNLIDTLRPGYVPGDRPMPRSMEQSPLFWDGLFSLRLPLLAGRRIRDIMNPPPPLVDASSNLMHVVHVLCQSDRRRVAVEQDGQIVGVIREQELFHEISRQLVGDW